MEEESATDKLTNLTKGLKIQDLVSTEGATFEVSFDDLPDEDTELCYSPSEAYKFSNPTCSGLVDEDNYTEGEPFEILSEKMTNLLEGGVIKKRILREGYGEVLPDKATVTIHYNAYIEYNDEPFDSTYIRKRPFTFILNNGATIPGLDIGVQSMKVAEKSQFLVKPEYALGTLGCLDRVPPNSTILYEVEVINYVDAGASITYPLLSNEEKREYAEIDKYIHALCAKANEMYNKGSIKGAIKIYNTAVTKLQQCTLRDYEEEEKQSKLLLRLLTNLVVSYTKINEPRRACVNCNKIYYLCKGTTLKVPAKVYFNHGRCLILLADYEWAEKKLKQAQKLEPQNCEISNELLKLDQKKKESYNREVALAKAIFKNNEINNELHEKEGVGAVFKSSMTAYCEELLNDDESIQYNLPEDLTKEEIDFCKQEAELHGLSLISKKFNGNNMYVIAKQTTSVDD